MPKAAWEFQEEMLKLEKEVKGVETDNSEGENAVENHEEGLALGKEPVEPDVEVDELDEVEEEEEPDEESGGDGEAAGGGAPAESVGGASDPYNRIASM